MEKDFVTRRKQIFRDEAEGDLLYDDCLTTVERTDDRIIVKVRVGKYQNWLQLADEFWCSLVVMDGWAFGEWSAGRQKIAEVESIERNEVFENHRIDMLLDDHDPFLYSYFHSVQNWVMYESDDEYLFLYELEIKDMYCLAITSQTEALHFWPKDDAAYLTDFLRAWYYRANGYPEEKDEEE